MTLSNTLHTPTPRACGLARRAGVAALDLACCCGMAALLWCASARPAAAYVDPSVMTYTIQALAGVAVALSAVLGVVWRRARRWLLGVLRIDENAGKVVEPSVAAAPAGAGEAARAQAAREAASERSLQGKEQPQNLPWSARFVLALLASATLAFSVLVAAPLEIVATNASALSFSPAIVWQPLALFALLVALAVALALSLLRGRIYDALLAVLVALGAASLLQALFLNGSLPPADGQPVNWSDYTKVTLASVALWLIVICGFVAVAVRKPAASKGISVVVCLVLVLTSAISMGTTISAHASEFDRPFVTEEGLMDVSNKSNVVVFVLDTFDTKYLDEITASNPNLLDELGGFTWFRNSTGSMIPTRHGVPFVVTGNTLDSSDTVFTYPEVQSWFSEHSLLDDAQAQGYSVGVYSDSINAGYDSADKPLLRQTINVHNLEPEAGDAPSIIRMLETCALYRNLPWVAKAPFRYYTDDLNKAVVSQDGSNPGSTPYILDDPSYYRDLVEQGLKVDDEAKGGAYRVIHLSGSHAPYNMDENAQAMPDGEESSLERQSIGSIKIVSEYIRQLKELGVYDQTTFIITADHGEWYLAENLSSATSPILLVKPAGADTSQPVAVSKVPTGHLDIPATIRKAIGVETDDPSVFDVTDEPRRRYFFWTDEHEAIRDFGVREWEVNGDALDFSDWSFTGRDVPIQ